MRNILTSVNRGILNILYLVHLILTEKTWDVIICFAALLFTPSIYAQSFNVGNRRQLFIDNRFIQSGRNVELIVHKPVKTGDICIPSDPGWELGRCVVLEKDGIYHMWYTASLVSLCYAYSTDGVNWHRPSLNLTTDDSIPKPNNVVLGFGAGGAKKAGGIVFIDPNAPADQCFRLITRAIETSSFHQVFSSPDGIHWKIIKDSLLTADTTLKIRWPYNPNVIFWDARLKKYVTYGRTVTDKGRTVGRSEFPDLNGSGKIIYHQDVISAGGREDIYTGGIIPYKWAEDVYFAFPTLYYHYDQLHNEFKNEAPTNAGILDTRFAVSRDGINWDMFNWHTFVPLGMEGEFDSKRIYMGYGIVPAVNGREMYMYYMGTNETHGWNRDDRNNRLLTAAGLKPHPELRAISRVVIRRDGFVSVHAPYEGGEFTTAPIRFAGNHLVLNIESASTGEVQVEIQDEKGNPIKGFSLKDCDMIHSSNEINRQVFWNGSNEISKFSGKTIRLHFVMRDTDLYAFQFL